MKIAMIKLWKNHNL